VGLGIDLIRDACRVHGSPSPESRWEGGLWAVFPCAPQRTGLGEEDGGTTQKINQKRNLVLLRAQPTLTRQELAAKAGISPAGVKYHLNRMRAAGIIRRVGLDRAGHWEIAEAEPSP
jgi:ATP-dependent DNA helicase RecG